ncbi:PIR protein [Plasmodium vivax]|uniref:VIR protein n=1 Tax=Plasmodium vivax TaxID=5855 RepID=A0A565A495_PLAVI|nr:PIR protein [Plasmodium vivax]
MRNTSYDVRNIYHTYKRVLDSWNPGSNFQTSEEFIFINQDLIKKHTDAFTIKHCLQAQHYLSNVEEKREPQYLSNGCKFFLYWLYYDVLNRVSDYDKVLKIYEDVLREYIEVSSNDYFKNYIKSFSEQTIEKIIKLSEMYEYFYKFKEEDKKQGCNKCDNAEKCVSLYNENIKVCEKAKDYDFCYELDNLKESYDTYMKTNECCSSLPKTLKSYSVQNPAALIITPFSILLVISLFIFFLYKFTPFGSLFRKKTKNKKKIPGNLDYATPVLPHTSQSVNNYNNNRQYNISYLSSGQ